MPKLVVSLKNGKQLESKDCPFVQAVMWRTKLQNGETIMLPTKNGLMRVDGKSVAFPSIEEYILLDTSQAASCMMLEPYMHFKNELGETYQYSSLSGDFEKAESRGRQVIWEVDALPESTWMRVGRDTIINTYSVV